jgi:hypothetical protein
MFFIYRSDQRIGIDLHGVIDHDIPTFKDLLTQFVKMGKEIWIISGPPKAEIEAELEKHGLKQGEHFHFVISVVDYLKEKGTKMWLDNKKTWWADEETWWASKGNICVEKDIGILIDDQERYKAGLPKDNSVRFLIYDKRGVLTHYKEKDEGKTTDN